MLVAASSEEDPQGSSPSGNHSSSNNELQLVRVNTVCDFQDQVIKAIAASISGSWLPCSAESQPLCEEVTQVAHGEAPMARCWASC